MASIKNVARLTKRVVLSNYLAEEGLAVTPMIVGQHGIGKSQIVKKVASDLGGTCFVVEGGSLKEGEITGLPFASPATDGTTEVRFIKYYAINKLFMLEKYYHEKALTTGFLNGDVKLSFDENGNKILHEGKSSKVIQTAESAILAGDDNKYKFGEYLSPETKFKLIETGEIQPVILFIDELNRTENMTMKELMNIILNKSVNGYDLPWWCSVVSAINPSSQNSVYATNELDPAQLDRFLKLKADSNIDEWVDYGLAKGINTDIIEAIAISEQIFIQKDSSLEDTSDLTPTPRSWEMVSHIYNTLDVVNNTKFFTAEERALKSDDFRTLTIGKVGQTAGRTLVENLNRKDSNIKPEEIITIKGPEVDKDVMKKFKGLKRLTQKIIADNVANYILKKVDEAVKWKTATKPEAKEKYMNWKSQIKEFTVSLDPTTQLLFATKILELGGKKNYYEISSYFSKEVLTQILASKKAIDDLNKE